MNHKQIAAELSVYQDLPIEEYTSSLTKIRVPAFVIQHFGGAMLDYQNGHMRAQTAMSRSSPGAVR